MMYHKILVLNQGGPVKGFPLRLNVMTGSPQLITFSHKIINSGEALVHGKGVKPTDLPTGRENMVQKSLWTIKF